MTAIAQDKYDSPDAQGAAGGARLRAAGTESLQWFGAISPAATEVAVGLGPGGGGGDDATSEYFAGTAGQLRTSVLSYVTLREHT